MSVRERWTRVVPLASSHVGSVRSLVRVPAEYENHMCIRKISSFWKLTGVPKATRYKLRHQCNILLLNTSRMLCIYCELHRAILLQWKWLLFISDISHFRRDRAEFWKKIFTWGLVFAVRGGNCWRKANIGRSGAPVGVTHIVGGARAPNILVLRAHPALHQLSGGLLPSQLEHRRQSIVFRILFQ